MKTLVLFQEIPDDMPFFFIVDEDWSRFHNVYINRYSENENDELLQAELCKLVYGDNGVFQLTEKKFDRLTKEHVWDVQIACGFIC